MKRILYIVLFFATPFMAWAATPAAVTPYTFIGRVMDAQHVAFGSNRVAKVAASTTDGDLLSRTTTFFRADSRRNYALQIPMATGEVDGYAVQNATLDITVTDDLGARIRKHPSFRAYYDDAGKDPKDDSLDCTRLVGRSAWNTKWLLIIPAGSLGADREAALSTFINGIDSDRDGKVDFAGVKDIKIGLKTYSTSGN